MKSPTALEVSCPCCGDPMENGCVVCWVCWRITDKLTPGTHGFPTFQLTLAQINKWTDEQLFRLRPELRPTAAAVQS